MVYKEDNERIVEVCRCKNESYDLYVMSDNSNPNGLKYVRKEK